MRPPRTTWIDGQVHARMKAEAARRGKKLKDLLDEALTEWLTTHEGQVGSEEQETAKG